MLFLCVLVDVLTESGTHNFQTSLNVGVYFKISMLSVLNIEVQLTVVWGISGSLFLKLLFVFQRTSQ